MPGKANPVTLPAAAANMAAKAVESVPDDFFVFTDIQGSAPASLAPESLPPQAQVPEDVPPVVDLPEHASHMSETARPHLPEHLHADWLIV